MPSNRGSSKGKPPTWSNRGVFEKTQLCKFFAKGTCSRGEKCSFAHGNDQLRARVDFSCTRLCTDFMRSGGCCAGQECRFAHGLDELRQAADMWDAENAENSTWEPDMSLESAGLATVALQKSHSVRGAERGGHDAHGHTAGSTTDSQSLGGDEYPCDARDRVGEPWAGMLLDVIPFTRSATAPSVPQGDVVGQRRPGQCLEGLRGEVQLRRLETLLHEPVVVHNTFIEVRATPAGPRRAASADPARVRE